MAYLRRGNPEDSSGKGYFVMPERKKAEGKGPKRERRKDGRKKGKIKRNEDELKT